MQEDSITFHPKATKEKPWWLVAVTTGVLAIGGAVAWAMSGAGPAGLATAAEFSPPVNTAPGGSKTGTDEPQVAVVNGLPITQSEVIGLIANGVDRAIAIDRYINKVIAAESAKRLYADQASANIRAAEREVLATLYTTRRMEELRSAVTDEDINTFYEKNFRQEDFKQWKLSYYLTGSQEDMEATLKKLKSGDKATLEKLAPLQPKGDGFLTANNMPYGLGRVVSKLRKGEFSEVLALRNGLMIVRIEDSKQLDMPKLEDVKPRIVETLATERLNEEIQTQRRAARIELG